jgi:glycosyltransferase involved in cell wall biosynthesis
MNRRDTQIPVPEGPAMSVIVCSYRGRSRLERCFEALVTQDLTEPYEIILVASGDDDSAEFVRGQFPAVRVLGSASRLNPGQARNVGVRAARGEFVAFIPDDGIARPDWLALRLRKHRQGFPIVGGAITNGTPLHPVGIADYYIEYSRLLPSARVLAERSIPYSLSFSRELLRWLGPYPEDTETGEDTIFNKRCLETGIAIGFEPAAQFAHLNLTRLRAFLRHQYLHGRGQIQCVERHGFEANIGPIEQPLARALYSIFVRYPAARWWKITRRVWRSRPASLLVYAVVCPLVSLGLSARSLGAWMEWRARRGCSGEPSKPEALSESTSSS